MVGSTSSSRRASPSGSGVAPAPPPASREGDVAHLDMRSRAEYTRGLYDRLHETGILSSLKSHLRTRILFKLKGQDSIEVARKPEEDDRRRLLCRALESLFADYLQSHGFDYTLSVFLPESGISNGSALTLAEILEVLKVQGSSGLAHRIAATADAGAGAQPPCMSVRLLGALQDVHVSSARHEAETQTWDLGGSGTSSTLSVAIEVERIETKMQERLASERALLQSSFETKMNDFRTEVELRSKADVDAQVDRVREIESRAIRIQEAGKAWDSLADEKAALERIHHEKLSAIRATELEAMQRVAEKWRSVEIKEAETRASHARAREKFALERETFEAEIVERRAGVERRERAVDERMNAVQVKQLEAERMLDFAAQQLEQTRLVKVRSMDAGTAGPGQPASPEIALQMLEAARTEAKELRNRVVERTRENEGLATQVRELERRLDAAIPRAHLDRVEQAHQRERASFAATESALREALRKANAAVDAACDAQEDAIASLEEAKMRAACAGREAADLRAFATELQLALDAQVYHSRRSDQAIGTRGGVLGGVGVGWGSRVSMVILGFSRFLGSRNVSLTG